MEHKKITPPQFDLVMGGVCTGKSHFIKENYKSGYTHIDAGDIFMKLSKGKYFDFPSTLEHKMNKIGLELANKAIAEKANIVMEVTGDNEEEVSQLIDELTEVGYEINVQGITCDEETALERNVNRSDDNISAYFTQPYHFKWMSEAIAKTTK